jgi:hypothetical protein
MRKRPTDTRLRCVVSRKEERSQRSTHRQVNSGTSTRYWRPRWYKYVYLIHHVSLLYPPLRCVKCSVCVELQRVVQIQNGGVTCTPALVASVMLTACLTSELREFSGPLPRRKAYANTCGRAERRRRQRKRRRWRHDDVLCGRCMCMHAGGCHHCRVRTEKEGGNHAAPSNVESMTRRKYRQVVIFGVHALCYTLYSGT